MASCHAFTALDTPTPPAPQDPLHLRRTSSTPVLPEQWTPKRLLRLLPLLLAPTRKKSTTGRGRSRRDTTSISAPLLLRALPSLPTRSQAPTLTPTPRTRLLTMTGTVDERGDGAAPTATATGVATTAAATTTAAGAGTGAPGTASAPRPLQRRRKTRRLLPTSTSPCRQVQVRKGQIDAKKENTDAFHGPSVLTPSRRASFQAKVRLHLLQVHVHCPSSVPLPPLALPLPPILPPLPPHPAGPRRNEDPGLVAEVLYHSGARAEVH